MLQESHACWSINASSSAMQEISAGACSLKKTRLADVAIIRTKDKREITLKTVASMALIFCLSRVERFYSWGPHGTESTDDKGMLSNARLRSSRLVRRLGKRDRAPNIVRNVCKRITCA
jgi:hypothetical protein